MQMTLSPEIAGLVGALGGSLLTLAGVTVAELGQSRRANQAIKRAEAASVEKRREELWEGSRAVTSKLQQLFAEVYDMTQHQPDPFAPPEVEFEEGFPEWWLEQTLTCTIDIAAIPFATYRDALEEVQAGISNAHHLVQSTSFARSYKSAVAVTSRLGIDITSSLLRDEAEPPLSVRSKLEQLAASLAELDQIFLEEYERSRNPKGYDLNEG